MKATTILSGDVVHSLARGWYVEEIERSLLEAFDDVPDVEITMQWHVYRKLTGGPLDDHPIAGQPSGDVERLSWCPGTPLPDRASYVTCTATAVP